MKTAKTMKEVYMDARVSLLKTNAEIARRYGVKEATVRKAIGSDKKFFKELYEEENNKMAENKEFAFTDENDEVIENKEVNNHGNDDGTIFCDCVSCGNRYAIQLTEQDFFNKLGYPLPKRCHECRKSRSNFKEFTCEDCGTTFTMSENEINFYNRNNLFLPKRCATCRKKRKDHLEELKKKYSK